MHPGAGLEGIGARSEGLEELMQAQSVAQERVGNTTKYSLGSEDHEIARLDAQAALLDRATVMLLRAGGIRRGMRVLDLGTGLGHVAFAAANLVGAEGRVVGIDNTSKIARRGHRESLRPPTGLLRRG